VIEAHVDMTKIRDGFAQDLTTYVLRRLAKDTNRSDGNWASVFEGLLKLQTANALIESLTAPAGLAKVAVGSRAAAGTSARGAVNSGRINEKLRSASFVSPTMFVFGLGEEGTKPDQWSNIIMVFEGLTWRVTAIRLSDSALAALIGSREAAGAKVARQPISGTGANLTKPRSAPNQSTEQIANAQDAARIAAGQAMSTLIAPQGAQTTPPSKQLGEPVLFGPQITAADLDAVREQIRPCWNPTIAGRNAKGMVVELEVWANPDGTVLKAVPRSNVPMSTDPYYQSAVAAAMRAVFNPRCQPLPLPADKYEQWKHFVLIFDPKRAREE
jgi:hypothetical protein